MRKRHHSRKKSMYGKNLIILPMLFCVIIYGVCLAVVLPAASSYLTLASLFFSDKTQGFSNEYNNIFVPVSETPEVSPASETSEEPKQETVSISSITFPYYDEQFGELIIEDCQINARLFFGDSSLALKNGVGIYNGSFLPGYGKTILVAGHNNTYFNGLKYAKKGQIIKIRTSYGNYRYEITDMQIKDKEDRSAYDLKSNTENLILYTCYPFDELGLTPNRYFVYAKLVSGPIIDKNS